jgi:uncharacterized membrane protein
MVKLVAVAVAVDGGVLVLMRADGVVMRIWRSTACWLLRLAALLAAGLTALLPALRFLRQQQLLDPSPRVPA